MRVRYFALLFACLLRATVVHSADRTVEPIISRIPREAVDSSGLAAVGYSRHLHALEIEFRDGLIYRYLEVPIPIYRGLQAADSKARFYNHKIRGKYHCLRVKSRRVR